MYKKNKYSQKQELKKIKAPVFYFLLHIFTASVWADNNWSIQLKDEIEIKNNKICMKEAADLIGVIQDPEDQSRWNKICFDYNKNKISKKEIQIELIRNNLFPVKISGNEWIKINRTDNEEKKESIIVNNRNEVKTEYAVNSGGNLIVSYSTGNIQIEITATASKDAHIGEIIEVKPKNGLNKILVRIVERGKAVFE